MHGGGQYVLSDFKGSPPKCSWRHAHEAGERLRELALVGEARLQRDISNRRAGRQQRTCVGDAKPAYVRADGAADLRAKGGCEVDGMDTGVLCERFECQPARKRGVQLLLCTGNPPRGGALPSKGNPRHLTEHARGAFARCQIITVGSVGEKTQEEKRRDTAPRLVPLAPMTHAIEPPAIELDQEAVSAALPNSVPVRLVFRREDEAASLDLAIAARALLAHGAGKHDIHRRVPVRMPRNLQPAVVHADEKVQPIVVALEAVDAGDGLRRKRRSSKVDATQLGAPPDINAGATVNTCG